ncbi:MAG: hypothetical protein U0L51_08295 [Olegusella sp.]|nr:hypothetical protein [Olegusella sp.]
MAQDENLARFADALREQGHPELADQAMSYASETGEGAQHVLPAKDVRHVTVRGVPLDIDAHRLRTWKCTELMARTQSESAPDGDRFLAGVELVTFLMGRDGCTTPAPCSSTSRWRRARARPTSTPRRCSS